MTNIVDIRFSFYNKHMLELIEDRAAALRKKDHKKVKKIEGELNYVADEHFDLIRAPNTFYVTFEHMEARQELLN